MKNQKGFSLIEALLVLIIVGILGFSGWYVAKARSNADKAYDATTSSSIQPAKKTSKAPEVSEDTSAWIAYSNSEGKYSLKYPPDWEPAENETSCDAALSIGPKGYSGHCRSDAVPEVMVTSYLDNKDVNYALAKQYYPDLKIEQVTVNGIKAQRYSGTLKIDDTQYGIGPKSGTKSVAYIFETGGRTYAAAYNQQPGWPDVLKNFDLMVTKTLQFHE